MKSKWRSFAPSERSAGTRKAETFHFVQAAALRPSRRVAELARHPEDQRDEGSSAAQRETGTGFCVRVAFHYLT
jgi:hypothetical protein